MAYLTHTVKSGESLSKIAAYYAGKGYKGVSWGNIASYNKIKSPYKIFTGQKIKVPYTSSPSKPAGPSPTGSVTGGNLKSPSSGSSGGANYGNAFNPEPVVNQIGGFIILYGFFKVLMKVF